MRSGDEEVGEEAVHLGRVRLSRRALEHSIVWFAHDAGVRVPPVAALARKPVAEQGSMVAMPLRLSPVVSELVPIPSDRSGSGAEERDVTP